MTFEAGILAKGKTTEVLVPFGRSVGAERKGNRIIVPFTKRDRADGRRQQRLTKFLQENSDSSFKLDKN